MQPKSVGTHTSMRQIKIPSKFKDYDNCYEQLKRVDILVQFRWFIFAFIINLFLKSELYTFHFVNSKRRWYRILCYIGSYFNCIVYDYYVIFSYVD